MYVQIFGYLVNRLEIWWVYLSPIEKIDKITNCIYITFPTIVLCFTYKCHVKIIGLEWERGRGYGNPYDKRVWFQHQYLRISY